MSKQEKTNAMRILDRNRIPYTAHFYEEGENPLESRDYGVHVAETLGEAPERCFKTLAAKGASGGVYVYEIPVGETLNLKKAAKAVGEKSVSLLAVKELNAVTGYVRGGCSPIGMKKPFPVVFHRTAGDYETIFISGGKIGVQVEAAPQALMSLLGASAEDLTVET